MRPNTVTSTPSPLSFGRPKRLIPLPPPVRLSAFRRIAGSATPIPKVARARYAPASRVAGRPKRSPATPATIPASGSVQMSRTSDEKVWPKSSSPWSETRIAVT